MIFVLTLLAALGCGLVAGVFLAFSAFVMKSLARLPAGEGIAAMQSINRVILQSGFMPVFFGTAILCILAVGRSLLHWQEPDAVCLLAGGVLYLAGSMAVTIAFNVPKNVALDAVRRSDADSESKWADYVASWTRWNHVRTAACVAAAAAFSVALGC